MGRELAVPTVIASVLKKIILIFVVGVVEDITLSAVRETFHPGDVYLFLIEFDRLQPPHERALISRVAGRCHADAGAAIDILQALRPTIITAGAHQVELPRSYIATVARIVKVGETKTMGELMTDGADTHIVGTRLAVDLSADDLIAACIGIDLHTIVRQRLADSRGCIYAARRCWHRHP